MCTTTQPFKKAIACAWRTSALLPTPFSPITSRLSDWPPWFSMCFASSSVSFRTSDAGLLKNPHPWLDLKLSAARRPSTADPGRPTMRPSKASLAMLFALQSCRPETSKALVLLSTIRLRIALRSPVAGGRTVLARLFLDRRSVRPPREGLTCTPFRAAGECGFFCKKALVEKAESCVTAGRIARVVVTEEVRVGEPVVRQRQQVRDAIDAVTLRGFETLGRLFRDKSALRRVIVQWM